MEVVLKKFREDMERRLEEAKGHIEYWKGRKAAFEEVLKEVNEQ